MKEQIADKCNARAARSVKYELWEHETLRDLDERNNRKRDSEVRVTVSKPVLALIAIIFGILVIVFPDLLQWIVGLHFILQGLLFFADFFELRKR